MARRKKKWPVEYLPNTEAWMTTFADLISLMLTFFILIVSMSTLDKTGLSDVSSSFTEAVSVMKPGRDTEFQIIPPMQVQKLVSVEELLLAMRQNAQSVLNRSTLSHKVRGTILRERLYLRIPTNILFDKGSAIVKPEHREALRKLAKMLARMPGNIRIEGHSGNDLEHSGGAYRDPWALSLARAASVLRIMEDEGVNPARLSLAGYGPSRPISANATPFGRDKNRRVELVIYR